MAEERLGVNRWTRNIQVMEKEGAKYRMQGGRPFDQIVDVIVVHSIEIERTCDAGRGQRVGVTAEVTIIKRRRRWDEKRVAKTKDGKKVEAKRRDEERRAVILMECCIESDGVLEA